jgi:hypothetical protein
MIRFFAVFVIAATLVPATAEARKFRLGGSSRSAEPAPASATPASVTRPGFAAGVGAGVVARPRYGRAQEARPTGQETDPSRVPFPPSSAQAPALLRLTSDGTGKVWCRSEVVIGGFCVLN